MKNPLPSNNSNIVQSGLLIVRAFHIFTKLCRSSVEVSSLLEVQSQCLPQIEKAEEQFPGKPSSEDKGVETRSFVSVLWPGF